MSNVDDPGGGLILELANMLGTTASRVCTTIDTPGDDTLPPCTELGSG